MFSYIYIYICQPNYIGTGNTEGYRVECSIADKLTIVANISGRTHVVVQQKYRQVSNIRRTLVGNSIVDHSDVVGASPLGAGPTTSSFSTQHLASIYCTKTTACRDQEHLGFVVSYIIDITVVQSIWVWRPTYFYKRGLGNISIGCVFWCEFT